MIQILDITMIVCWFGGIVMWVIALIVGGDRPDQTRADTIGNVLMILCGVCALCVAFASEFG